MTEEEVRAEREEAERLMSQIDNLVRQINHIIGENRILEQELIYLTNQIYHLIDNASYMDSQVTEEMSHLSDRVGKADICTKDVFEALKELTVQYFTLKSISTASKNISQYTDEYYTRFSYYNELRRITLGYVIGLDSHIVSSDAMRKKVEKAYLQNTEYWLAYCIAAVQLWASNEMEAAERAVGRSLSTNYFNSCLFYLLINLRFNRVETAKKWYVNYLDRADMNNLGDEWQYLLQAYLSGAFGADKAFEGTIAKCFVNMISQIEVTTVDYGKMFATRASEFATTFIHSTGLEFAALKKTCSKYEELKQLLSEAEKNTIIAKYYNDIAEKEVKDGYDLPQRIENVLYSLISNYDADELSVVKRIKYNEAIVAAKGDVAAAQVNYNLQFSDENSSKNIADLLLHWAFSEESLQIDIRVKRFSINMMKDWIIKGFESYAEGYRKKEREKYDITIDDCKINCSEEDFEPSKVLLEKYYDNNKLKNTFKDKFVAIYTIACFASLLTLLINVFFFNPVILVLGILLGLAGSFLLWRRIVDVGKQLKERKRLGVNLLKKALEELDKWRTVYKAEDEKNINLKDALESF